MGYEILNKSLETMQHENTLHYVVKKSFWTKHCLKCSSEHPCISNKKQEEPNCEHDK